MTKRNVKATVDKEPDRSRRESSSDGSVLENPINNGTKNNKSRKCKAQGSNKTASILKLKTSSKSKHLSESSCDSMVNEECNLAKHEEIASNDKNRNMPEHSSGDPIENHFQERIPDGKESQTKINSDKYSELLSILSGKEGDIDTFIKQYTIWQQSQSSNGKPLRTKKNVAKSTQVLQKPMKSKAIAATPLIKLTKKTNSKKVIKDSNNRSSVPNQEGLKQPDSSENEIKNTESSSSENEIKNIKNTESSSSENEIKNTESSSSENEIKNIKNTESSSSVGMEDSNIEIKSVDSNKTIGHLSDTKTVDKHSKVMAEDIADCCKDVNIDMKPNTVYSKVKSKSLRGISNVMKHENEKPEELPKEEITKSLNPINTQVKVVDADFKDSSKHPITTKSEISGSKQVEVSDEDPYIVPEITTKVINLIGKSDSENEINLNNEEVNNVIVDLDKKDLVHEDEDKKSEICGNDNLLDYLDSDNLFSETIQKNGEKNNSNIISNLADESKENEGVNCPNELLSNNPCIKDSFSEVAVNDLSKNDAIKLHIGDKHLDSKFDGSLPNLKSKSQSCSSIPNIENNIFEELQHFDSENKEKTNTSAVLIVSNVTVAEGDSENDIVWKRKRRISDEKNDCSKRTKLVTRLNDAKFEQLNHDITSSEPPFNKWNTEESNSFFEELIYSDEEKNNFNDDHITYNISKSADLTKFKENLSHKTKKNTSKSDLDKKIIEKSNSIKNNYSLKDGNFYVCPEFLKESTNVENVNASHKEVNKEWKEKKSTDPLCGSSRRNKYNMMEKDKITKISSKSKNQMKSKVRSPKSKKSSNRRVDVEDLQIKNECDISYESMLKKVKKQLKNGNRCILETDLPVVEVSYKGESLHGILGSVNSIDFLTKFRLNKEKQRNENILSSIHAQEILIQSLRPLCSEMVRECSCKNIQNCRKGHMVSNDFFSIMDKHDAWLIVAFILRISNCLSENILTAILEFLSKHKARRKILLVSRHIFQSQQNNYPILKSYWEDILIALECCGLQRWEGIRSVIQFIIDTHSSLKAVVFHKLLKIWNVHQSSFSNTWQIVEPLVTGKIIVLHPLILSKLMGEIIAVEPKDKVNIYRLLVQQLTSLTNDNFIQISYRLLNDFLRKVSQEGLHSEEKVLREIMKTSYYSPFFPQQSPTVTNSSSLRRCRSLTNLSSISSDNKFHINATVHEEEKMEAAMQRALQCSNYDSIVKVIIASYNKVFINKVLLLVFNYAMDKNSFIILKNIFAKLKTSFAQYVDEAKDLIGNIVVTLMLDSVKQFNWKEANNYFNLLEENHVNKYKLKSLTDGTLRPVRLAVVYSEIHYYNGRYKESIGVFINTRLIDPDSVQWIIPGGSKDDFQIIGVMIVFLLNELINKKIINIATMLFKAVLEVQNSLTEPIEIGNFFEVLLYKLFEQTEEYPETAVKLYMRVMAKDNNVTLCGLTYRALIILAYRTHKRAIIKDIFYKAINEYVYPIIEANENVIILLRSHTEEEIIVYILEWVARFKEKISDSSNYQIKIRFKDAVLEDYLDNKDLGIPALLKEVDQTLPGAFKRLESVLKRLHLKFKQIKKDTFSIDPLSFQNFLNKIKV